ncbi:MAG: hypothetical protein ACJ8AI_23910 [Rhodopila sp.]
MRLVLFALSACVSHAAWASDITTRPIQFARGAHSAVVEGHISGHQSTDYTIRAHAGQTANISLASRNPGVTFNLIAPGEKNVAFHIGSVVGNQFEGALPKDGEYRIRVYLTKGAISNHVTAHYRLEVIIGAAGAASTAGTAASASARGSVPCAQSRGQPMGQCPFSVLREGHGNATVTVTLPDGRERAIIFQHGKAVTANTSQADGNKPFRVRREEDLNIISVAMSATRFRMRP